MLKERFYVDWGALALINAGLAQGKNRSGLNWFLLSLLFGPLATLCIVLLKKKVSLAHRGRRGSSAVIRFDYICY